MKESSIQIFTIQQKHQQSLQCFAFSSRAIRRELFDVLVFYDKVTPHPEPLLSRIEPRALMIYYSTPSLQL